MKEILIILDGLMEKKFENENIQSLLLDNINSTFKKHDFSVKEKDIDSLNCILNMLGYSPIENIGDRSFYEGLSQGIIDYESILRCNVVKVYNNKLVDFTGGDLPENIFSILKSFNIKNGYVHPMQGYKNLLVLKEDKIFERLNPPHFNIGKDIEGIMPKDKYLKNIIKESNSYFKCLGYENLYLWPWGASGKVTMKPFYEKYKKIGGVISGIDLVKGIGLILGLKSIKHSDFTGDIDTNLKGKLKLSLNMLQEVDVLIVHINGLDEISHRKDFKGKLEFLDKIKKEFLLPLVNNVENTKITITCDHRTDCFTGGHEKGWVPIINIV